MTKETKEQELKTKEAVMVSYFTEFSEASKSGLKEGDVILRIDGYPISSIQAVTEAIRKRQLGDIVAIETENAIFNVQIVNNPFSGDPGLGLGLKLVEIPV